MPPNPPSKATSKFPNMKKKILGPLPNPGYAPADTCKVIAVAVIIIHVYVSCSIMCYGTLPAVIEDVSRKPTEALPELLPKIVTSSGLPRK